MKNKFQIENFKLKISNGFTLVELLIYMALLAIFLITLTGIFVNILEVQLESDATSAVDQDGRFILARLNYDINRATSVSTPSSFGSPGINNLSILISGDTYSYATSGENMQLTNILGTNNLNSSETTVTNLNFQRIANTSIPGTRDTIKIQFTINSKTQRAQGAETKTFTTTVGLR